MSSDSDTAIFEEMRKPMEKPSVLAGEKNHNIQVMKGLQSVDRDIKVKVNNRFLDWLADNGVWVKTVSTWGRAPHPLVIASETESEGESCGRGILARENMGQGELMMTIPLDICFTKRLAQEEFGETVIDDSVNEYIAIALLLISEKLKGGQSKWRPYFDILPSVETVNPSFIWTEAELEVLKGSPTYFASLSLRKKVLTEYRSLRKTFSTFKNGFSIDQVTPELFLWAFVMLFSRAARLTSKQSGEELALVPYADLMNHNPFSNTYIDAQKSGMPLFSRKEEVAVYADRSYKQFEQVFINYGDKGNGDLLLLYGFALDRNPFDAVEVSIGLSKEDPLFEEKKKYLENAGKNIIAARFPLQRDRYPSELVDFLRLLLVEKEDLAIQSIEKINFNEPLSPSLERKVLNTIVEICQSYLQRYPTTLEQDEVLVADKSLFQTFTRQQRMAVKLRVSEKKILKQTIAAVEEEVDKLPRSLSPSQTATAAGRSFDPLRSATTKSAKDQTLDQIIEKRGSGDEAVKSPEKALSIAERRRKRRQQE